MPSFSGGLRAADKTHIFAIAGNFSGIIARLSGSFLCGRSFVLNLNSYARRVLRGNVSATGTIGKYSFQSMPVTLVAIMVNLSALKMRLCIALIGLSISITGCGGGGVREDRRVEFSRDGGQVAFQHGDQGVYVAGKDGQGLAKIFQPDESVLATSRPLSCPTDSRMIFTTAEPLISNPPGQAPQSKISSQTPAEGRIVWGQPVRYTCWLRSDPHGEQPAVVKKLFDASCGHLGYVSGGLAVRWHPDGQHVLYCASLDQELTQHTVFEFNIASAKTRRVFPHSASFVICDWTPRGSHLVCEAGSVPQNAGSNSATTGVNGTWVGSPGDDKSWWQIPGTERLATGELPSVIEMLRASRPAWTRDDTRCAFVCQSESSHPAGKSGHVLQRLEYANLQIHTITRSEGPFTDLHWSPDGKQLGYLQHDVTGATLNVVDTQDQISRFQSSESIRKFAGFDASGRHMAYVVADRSESRRNEKHWALLLISNPLRDSVRIADAHATHENREIFSGMQVTFPLWSPTDDRLSLWLTFTPRYRSLVSIFGLGGLWPGDPAATIEINTGAISWLAISPQEELQVGHYHLLKRNAAEAWHWYEKARQKLPAAQPPASWEEFIRRIGAPENSQLFEYLCLKQLGRDADATAKWTEFLQNFYPASPAPPKPGDPIPPTDPLSAMFGVRTELVKPLLRDLFIAEVFLSVDGLDEALRHFREPVVAESVAAAFSRAVVLAQLMLIARDNSGYLNHCAAVVAPLALLLWQADQTGETKQGAGDDNQSLQLVAGLCLAPLFREEFLKQVPADQLQQQILVWKELAAKQQAGVPALAIDLVLRAAASRLADSASVQQAEERIAANPASQQLFAERPIDEVTASWFEFAQAQAQRP